MWEVKCLVGDKKLLEVMRLLKGMTLEPPVILPVDISKPNGMDKTRNPAPGQGSTDLLRKFLPGRGKVTSRELREHCMTNGYSKNGYSYALKRLLGEGSLKRTKEPRLYEVKI